MNRLTCNRREIMELTGWGRDKARVMMLNGTFPNIGSKRRPLVPRSAVLRFIEEGGKK